MADRAPATPAEQLALPGVHPTPPWLDEKFLQSQAQDYHALGAPGPRDAMPMCVIHVLRPWPEAVAGLKVEMIPMEQPPRLYRTSDLRLSIFAGLAPSVLVACPSWDGEERYVWNHLFEWGYDVRPMREFMRLNGHGLAVADVIGWWQVNEHAAEFRGFPDPPFRHNFWWHLANIRPLVRPIRRPGTGFPNSPQMRLSGNAVLALKLQGYKEPAND